MAKQVSAATRALLDQMDEENSKPSADKLERARAKVAELRDLELQKADWERQAKEAGEKINIIKSKDIVDIFDEVGIDRLGLPAAGNSPPYEIELMEYVHANIPEDRAEEAFAWMRKTKNEDLIKTTYTVSFGLKQSKENKAFAALLKKNKVPHSMKQGVPWNTLTSFVRKELESGRSMTKSVMEILGATNGRVAKVVKQKVEK